MKELISIQAELECHKGQFNSFGKYHYRSCEDILTAVKPLLAKYHVVLTVSDEIVHLGNHVYIQAVATIQNTEKETVYCNGFARHADTKKGMDDAQITGSASSYARKYALNGLFLIDDVKDSDSTNTHGKAPQQPRTDSTPSAGGDDFDF